MKKLLAVASWALPPLVLIAVGVAGYATRDRWESWLPDANIGEAQEHPVDAHAGHDHGDAGDAIVLSDRARRNLGLEVGTIEVGTYWQKLPIPGEVVEIPGRSDLALTSRVAGVVDEVYVLPGQAVRPGRPLFKIQITGDEVITAQSAMVNAIQQTKVNQAEIDRITPLVPNVVPEATLLKIQYDQQKLAVQRDLHEQELRAHGLSDEQIRRVAAGNAILKELTVTAPVPVASTAGQIPDPVVSLAPSSPAADQPDTVYSVASVEAYRGRLVQSGDHLGTLADHADLLVRGHAFEKEGDSVERALVQNWPITVEFVGGDRPTVRDGLSVLYTENVVAAGSRTVEFFLALRNEVVGRREGPAGGEYLSWRFKPGQQARLFVPVKQWDGVIVLPARAVTEEGPDAFAFAVNGKKLERRQVHVVYQDGRNVVVANDRALFPGEPVALNNAYQLNLALKKQQGGGGADPHAGHMH